MPGQDQNVTYRVNIDDSNFQAKLTSMRASLDSAVGGGMSPQLAFGMASMYQPGNFGQMNMSGMSNMISPMSFTPPAISMQPHFGMFSIQQNLRQAGLNAIGPMGMGMNSMMDSGIFSQKDIRDPRMSIHEYMAYSGQAFADRVQSGVTGGTLGMMSLGSQIAVGGAGSALGSAMFSSGLGMFAGGLVGGAVGGSLAGAYVSAVAERANDNIQMQSALESGSWRFYQGQDVDKFTGRGMSRSGRLGAATAIQNMELQDARFNATDYKQILEGGMQMGMFEGTHDMEDFKQKFKGLVENLKIVSSTLHTSLQDGLAAMRAFRDMGVTNTGEVNRLTMGSELAGRMSGKTGMEMLATGQTGAELFRGTGITMQRGFELAQENAVTVRNMLNNGNISRETVQQMGGEAGAAQQLTGNALSQMQSMVGRTALMSAFNPATGEIDTGKLLNGRESMLNMAGRAAGLGMHGIMELDARQEEIVSKLDPTTMKAFTQAQMLREANMIREIDPGMSMESAMLLGGKRLGMSYDVTKANIGELNQDLGKLQDAQDVQMNNMRVQATREAYGERYGWKVIGNAIGRTIYQPVSGGINRMASSVADETQGIIADIGDTLTGGYNVRGAAISQSLAKVGMAAVGNSPRDAQVRAEQEQRRGFIVSDEEKDTSKMKLESEKVFNLYAAMDKGLDLNALTRTVFGKEKALGDMTHEEIVKARAYAAKVGATDLVGAIDDKGNDAADKTAKDFRDAAQVTKAAKSSVQRDLAGKSISQERIDKIIGSGDALSALRDISQGKNIDQAKMLLRSAHEELGLDDKGINELINRAQGDKGFGKDVENLINAAGKQSNLGGAIAGTKQGEAFTGTTATTVSTANIKAITDMSNVLIKQMETLKTMQDAMLADAKRGRP